MQSINPTFVKVITFRIGSNIYFTLIDINKVDEKMIKTSEDNAMQFNSPTIYSL